MESGSLKEREDPLLFEDEKLLNNRKIDEIFQRIIGNLEQVKGTQLLAQKFSKLFDESYFFEGDNSADMNQYLDEVLKDIPSPAKESVKKYWNLSIGEHTLIPQLPSEEESSIEFSKEVRTELQEEIKGFIKSFYAYIRKHHAVDLQSVWIFYLRAKALVAGEETGVQKKVRDKVADLLITVLEARLKRVLSTGAKHGVNRRLASGQLWASRFHRHEFLDLVELPIKELERKFPDWMEIPRFKEKVKEWKERKEEFSKIEPNRYTFLSYREIIYVVSCFLGLGVELLALEEGQKAYTIFVKIAELTDALLDRIPNSHAIEVFRFRFHLLWLILRSSVAQTLRIEKDRMSPLLKRASIAKVTANMKEWGERFSKEVEYWSDELKEEEAEIYRSIAASSFPWFMAELARVQNRGEDRFKWMCQYLATFLGNGIVDALDSPDGVTYIDKRSGASSYSSAFAEPYQALTTNSIAELVQIYKSKPQIIQHLIVLAYPALTAAASEIPHSETSVSQLIIIRSFYEGLSRYCQLGEIPTLIGVMLDAETRFRYANISPFAGEVRHAAISLLGKERLLRAAKVSEKTEFDDSIEGNLSLFLFEGLWGQLFSQEIRMRLATVRLSRSLDELREVTKIAQDRLRKEKEAIAIIKSSVENLSEKDLGGVPFASLQKVLALDEDSRTRMCVEMVMELALTYGEIGFLEEGRRLLEEEISNLNEGDNLRHLLEVVIKCKETPLYLSTLESTLAKLEVVSRNQVSGVVLAGPQLELYPADENDYPQAVRFLSQQFAVASRVQRRAILPARCRTMEKFEVAIRYSRAFCHMALGLKSLSRLSRI